MKNLSFYRVLCVATVVLFVVTLALEANARGRGGGGGRGGGMRVSRSGPASGGSFSSRSSQARSTKGTQNRSEMTPRDTATRQDARTDNQVERQSSLSEASEKSQDQRGDRQEGREERTEDRYDHRDDAREDGQDHHYDHYHNDDWDNWVGYAAAGTVVVAGAAVIGSTISESTYSELSCTPEKVEVDGITYVQCGGNWYMPSFKGGEVTYVVVDPPSEH